MSRSSTDEFDVNGVLVNGYDYELQVWVQHGRVVNCGHPASMRPGCCNGDLCKGLSLIEARARVKVRSSMPNIVKAVVDGRVDEYIDTIIK